MIELENVKLRERSILKNGLFIFQPKTSTYIVIIVFSVFPGVELVNINEDYPCR
jgi:hypothetical protein